MKHNLKITIVILAMFIITQFIGLYVINHYSVQDHPLPYGMETPEVTDSSEFYTSFFPSIIISFVFAVLLLILFTKFDFGFVLKIWFFVVIIIALGIFLTTFFPNQNQKYIPYILLAFVIPLAVLKVYKRNILIHNLTELVIYPSIAAVFVPLLNFWTIIILLVLICIYDAWAVWKSGIMQKMAKYQMNDLKIFSGFFIPYISQKVRMELKKLPKSELKNKKVKANVAILGGGDVVFPIITSGVMLVRYGFWPAIFVIFGATLGIAYLLIFAKKKKFYPAMPFITVGIFLGILASILLKFITF
jgi:presenilin-like A22 family membrane protease